MGELFPFLVESVTAAEAAVLLELQFLRRLLLVLRRLVVPLLALAADQRDVVSHFIPQPSALSERLTAIQ
jgi:hypothetical protein